MSASMSENTSDADEPHNCLPRLGGLMDKMFNYPLFSNACSEQNIAS